MVDCWSSWQANSSFHSCLFVCGVFRQYRASGPASSVKWPICIRHILNRFSFLAACQQLPAGGKNTARVSLHSWGEEYSQSLPSQLGGRIQPESPFTAGGKNTARVSLHSWREEYSQSLPSQLEGRIQPESPFTAGATAHVILTFNQQHGGHSI